MALHGNLSRFQGSTLGYAINFTKDKIGYDITNYKVYFTLKSKKEDADSAAVINKIITSHTDTTHGKTLIEFQASETIDLLGNYYYSISCKDTVNNIEDVLFYGRMTILKTTRKTRD